MLKELFVGRARQAVPIYRQFETEARADGARFIEAEHVLLALAASDTDAGKLLIEAGLDHERLAAALRDERRQSLAYAGVQGSAETLTATVESDRPVGLGTSSKAALGRAMQARHQQRSRRRLDGIDFLVGILTADLGTVPRALALAGVDRQALIARARSREG